MARFERTVTIDHEIGSHGELRIRTVDGRVRLRGVDATTVRVVAVHRVRAADDAAADRAVEAAGVRFERGPGRLEVDSPDRTSSPLDVLGQLLSGSRVRVDFDVDVPHSATVEIHGVSADVAGEGLAGRQAYRTVSGALRLVDAAGSVEADAVSGRVEVFGPAPIELRAHTISGQVQVAATELRRVQVGTTSGGVDLAGLLDAGTLHSVSSVSGGVRLATDGGVTVDLRSMSGGVRSELPHRVESAGGTRRVIVGDGRARLRIQSVSGGLEVMRPGVAGPQRPADPLSMAGRESPGAPNDRPASSGWATSSGSQPAFVASGGEAAAGDSGAFPPGAAAGGTAESASGASASGSELGILRALERGEIGVEEAAARLAAAGRTSRQPGEVTTNA